MSDHTTFATNSNRFLPPRRHLVLPGPAYYGAPSLVIFNDAGWHWCHLAPPIYFGRPRHVIWEKLL